MQLNEITQYLETIAPLSYQESYDNSGLLCGDKNQEVKAVLVTLDCTEAIVDEAIQLGCNLIIAHHPIVFSGLKKITGATYIERVLIKAIKNDIAIYAIHTNLDSVLNGVNAEICKRIGLLNTAILKPQQSLLRKLITYCPVDKVAEVREALFKAGAGNIGNYDACSFNSDGYGTFRGNADSKPFVGNVGEIHTEKETKLEVIFPVDKQGELLKALFTTHPYEEVAYDIIALENKYAQVGSGMVGELPETIDELVFLNQIKQVFKSKSVKYTQLLGKKVKKVAVCGGSGSFLLNNAIAAGADIFITSDFKYHQFFDAENKIVIADIGHYESEQYTKELLEGLLTEKFPIFAVHLSKINTNPVNYL